MCLLKNCVWFVFGFFGLYMGPLRRFCLRPQAFWILTLGANSELSRSHVGPYRAPPSHDAHDTVSVPPSISPMA